MLGKVRTGADPRTLLRNCVFGGISGKPRGHKRLGGPRLEGFVILGSEESKSKTRAAGCSPLVGGGGLGKIRVPAPRLVLVAVPMSVGRGFPSPAPCAVAPTHDCASGNAMRSGSLA